MDNLFINFVEPGPDQLAAVEAERKALSETVQKSGERDAVKADYIAMGMLLRRALAETGRT